MTATIPGTRAPVRMWLDPTTVEHAALDQVRNVANLPWTHGVAVMPDAHYGHGATVGSVIAMRDAVSPSAVGVDIGCFRGDTRVPLLNGRQRSLKELAEGEGPYWVYSLDNTGQIVPGLATALRTRTDADLMRVTVSGGDEIVCTPDHLFMMNDGSYREARKLRFNDSLMPLYRRWQTRDGYESVSTGKGTSRQTHVLVYEALNGQVPDGRVVHHRNHIHFDNTPENLEALDASEHSRYHRRTKPSFDNESPAFQERRLAGIQRSTTDPVRQAQMVQVGTANISRYMAERPEHFREAVADNGRRGAAYLARFNTSPRACSDCPEEAANPAALYWHKKREHGHNHKVIALEFLVERSDAYCLNVEKYHNFAIASGVFVHNCGMSAAQVELNADQLPDNLAPIRAVIEDAVPVGQSSHDGMVDTRPLPEPVTERSGPSWSEFWASYDKLSVQITTKRLDSAAYKHRVMSQIGTLGGGNHFIELCLDEADRVWLMLHSGSRNVGKELAERHIAAAKELPHNQDLPDRDLAVFLTGSPEMDAYRRDLFWAQEYARRNRSVMMGLIKRAVREALNQPLLGFGETISCHHNYLSEETYDGLDLLITRKGAISTEGGRLGIIPGSMGTGSYIVRGRGNQAAYCSASHGAGRKMSRGAAKRTFTVEDLQAQTAGVECRKDQGVLDEIPGAYKSLEEVMAQQTDLVEVVHRLRTIVCVKG